MRLPRILSRRVQPTNVPFYSYVLTPNPVPSNGALNFVFQKKWLTPVQTLEGPGKRAGTFQIFNQRQPELRADLALPAASIQGAGVVAGSTQLQRLWRQNQYGQIYLGEKVIP